MLEPASKTNDVTRAERVVALYLSVRSALVVMRTNASAHARFHSRGALPKNFLAFFTAPPPTPPPQGEMERKGNFWFCFAISSPKSSVQISIYLRAFHFTFFYLMATRSAPLSALGVTLYSANHTQPPSHSPLAFARGGCFGVVHVRLVASREFGGYFKSIVMP